MEKHHGKTPLHLSMSMSSMCNSPVSYIHNANMDMDFDMRCRGQKLRWRQIQASGFMWS